MKAIEFKFNLGDTVEDTITGYKGIAVACSRWLNGCTRYEIQKKELTKDGLPAEPQWFDESQLVIVKAAKPVEKEEKPPEGPRPNPRRANDPIF